MQREEIDSLEAGFRKKITLLSFICSILVIYIHTYNLEVYGINEESQNAARVVWLIESYGSHITGLAVPMFFMISGLLFYRSFEINKLWEKWKTRLVSVLIPYLIWATIYYLFQMLCTNIPMIHQYMNAAVVPFSVFEWIRWLWVDQYYILWFLKDLIVYILLAPLIWLLMKNWHRMVPTGLIVLMALGVLVYLQIGSPWISGGLFMYLAGAYLGLNHRRALLWKDKRMAFICAAYVLFQLLSGFLIWNLWLHLLFNISLWFTMDLIVTDRLMLPWWFSATFFVYVFHDMILETMEKIYLRLFGVGWQYALIDYLCMPWLTLAIIVAVAAFLRRCAPTCWRVLSGNRV